jgi:hypothetical protein
MGRRVTEEPSADVLGRTTHPMEMLEEATAHLRAGHAPYVFAQA